MTEQSELWGRELWPYQVEGVRELWRISDRWGGALLADDMGSGKSCQSLAALPANAKALVVCPTSLKYNWRDECHMTRPDLTPIVCEGLGLARFKWPSAGEIVILGYNQLPDWLEPPPSRSGHAKSDKSRAAKARRAELRKAREKFNKFIATQEQFGAGTIVIYDEAQAIKNYDAARARRARILSALCSRVWLLTGTPMPRGSAIDCRGILWSGQLEHVFGDDKNFNRLAGIVFIDGQPVQGEPLPAFNTALKQVMIRRTKDQILPHLPPKIHRTLTVELDSASAEILASVPPEIAEAIEAATTPAALSAVQAMPGWSEFASRRRDLARARIPAMLEFLDDLESAGGRTLVFSAHREPILALGKRKGWATILGGGASAEVRQELTRTQRDYTGIGLTFGAGASGLNFASFDHVLYVDLDWDVNNVRQSQDRIHRPGQEAKSVTYTYLTSDVALDRLVTSKLSRAARNVSIAIDGEA